MKKKFIDEIYKMLQIKLLRKYLEDLQQIKSMKNKKNQILWIKLKIYQYKKSRVNWILKKNMVNF